MKCDELKEVMNVMQVSGEHIPSGYYEKSDVDAAIAELKAKLSEKDREIALLKERICNGDVSRLTWIDDCIAKDKEIAKLEDKCQMHDFFWEGCGFAKRGFKNIIAVSEAFDKLEAENERLKAKLEDVQASAYTDSVDAGMRERRLRRALYKACANWAHFVVAFFSSYATKEKWHKMERKCLNKMEEYK